MTSPLWSNPSTQQVRWNKHSYVTIIDDYKWKLLFESLASN
jgi:signal transduction histidine kinase